MHVELYVCECECQRLGVSGLSVLRSDRSALLGFHVGETGENKKRLCEHGLLRVTVWLSIGGRDENKALGNELTE